MILHMQAPSEQGSSQCLPVMEVHGGRCEVASEGILFTVFRNTLRGFCGPQENSSFENLVMPAALKGLITNS